MAYGVTPDGFVRKTFEVLDAQVSADLRARISPNLQLTEKTWLGNVKKVFLDGLAELWEVHEAGYYAQDPHNADETSFVALCEQTGTKRNGTTKGIVTAQIDLDTGIGPFAPGTLVAHVQDQPTNRWVNRDTIALTTVDGFRDAVFEAETAGARGVANAGTLNVIAQPVSGWNAITNALESTDGQDVESLVSLAARRELELVGGGAGTADAVAANVERVSGVISVLTRKNKKSITQNGLPPNSYRVIVWDGVSPAASNDAIAQAIFDYATDGIEDVGGLTGTAYDRRGDPVTMHFDRATQVPVYITLTIDGKFDADAVRTAVVNAGGYLVGQSVLEVKHRAAPMSVAGVTNVPTIHMGRLPLPSGTGDLYIDPLEIAILDESRIRINGVGGV